MPGVVVVVVVGARAAGEGPRDIFTRVHTALIESLDIDTPRIEQCGLSDLAIDGRKVLGSSLYLPQRPYLYCYQSSLLVDADVSPISRYLAHPPKEPAYRAGRPHNAFCTTLAAEGIGLSVEEVCRRVGTRLGALVSAQAADIAD
jgi:lipoate-protein ligase A